MRRAYQEIRQLGGEIMVVSFAQPAMLAVYERAMALPFLIVTDPTRTAYQAFGLERTSWLELVRPRVLWGYFRLTSRGWMPRLKNKSEDALQLGGDFVLDGQRRLVYAHRCVQPTDRPPVVELLQAVATARG